MARTTQRLRRQCNSRAFIFYIPLTILIGERWWTSWNLLQPWFCSPDLVAPAPSTPSVSINVVDHGAWSVASAAASNAKKAKDQDHDNVSALPASFNSVLEGRERGLAKSARDVSSRLGETEILQDLARITQSSTTSSICEDGLSWVDNRMATVVSLSSSESATSAKKGQQQQHDSTTTTTTATMNHPKIPKIIHQTSKSRCLGPHFLAAFEKWNAPSFLGATTTTGGGDNNIHDWSHFLHDDQAVQRLFQEQYANMPLLEFVVEHCLVHGTARADLWRYLVLWVYGGVYVDLDAAPAALTAADILAFSLDNNNRLPNDALFVVEQYHMLSQYFMAVSPRHPLMFYAIHHALANLLKVSDTGAAPTAVTTGPHALHQAYMTFRKDAGVSIDPAAPGYKPVWAGRFNGTYGRTVTVIGVGENQNQYVHRDVLGAWKKKKEYAQMKMRHFQEDKKFPSGKSCLSAIMDSYS